MGFSRNSTRMLPGESGPGRFNWFCGREMIVFNKVDFFYPGRDGGPVAALKGISLAVPEGEFLLILGGNGSGKSTLLKLVRGLLLPSGGTVRVRGLDTAGAENRRELDDTVSMVLSRPADMIFSPVVEEDVAFGLECRGRPPEEIRRRVGESLHMLGMEKLRRGRTHRLSGGEQQKVVLAGALARSPRVLLLDEPTAYLDGGEARRMLELVRSIQRRTGMTLLLATQRPDLAPRADRVLVLREGEIVFCGPPADLLDCPRTLRALGLVPSKTVLLKEYLRKKGIPVGKPCHTPELLARRLCELRR